MINLIPVPPLDGFGIIAPYLDEETREKVSTPPMPLFALIVIFLVMANVPAVTSGMFRVKTRILELLGFDFWAIDMIRQCFNIAIAGRND
jgi:Zn-dependent protease